MLYGDDTRPNISIMLWTEENENLCISELEETVLLINTSAYIPHVSRVFQ